MRKQPHTLIVLKRAGRHSLQSQLVDNFKTLVRRAVMQAGEAVPSTRELARDLQVSRNTVVQAYDRLIGEGYLDSSPRRGLFVSKSLAGLDFGSSARKFSGVPRSALPLADALGIASPRPFRPCQPDVNLFPAALWSRIRNKAIKAGGANLFRYQSHLPLGLPALRKTIADYLQESRGVNCDWRQVAITSGSQQALFLLAQVVLRPGSIAVIEDPGYLGARVALKHAGARLHPAPVDSEGVQVSGVKADSAQLIYVTPSRQFPTGACLSLARRIALVEFAARTKAFIVEDDYDSEFRYSQPPLPSLQSLDSSDRVVYVGSMSKVLFPSLRIGYLVLPPALIERFGALRSVVDDHGPLIEQAALGEFIECGAFARHIRRCRNEYGGRLQTFLESAARLDLPLEFPHTDGGMNVAGFLHGRERDGDLAAGLQTNGLDVPSLSSYSLKRVRPGLVFGFTAFSHAMIRKSLELVARTLEGGSRYFSPSLDRVPGITGC